jgi:hypothetical protein
MRLFLSFEIGKSQRWIPSRADGWARRKSYIVTNLYARYPTQPYNGVQRCSAQIRIRILPESPSAVALWKKSFSKKHFASHLLVFLIAFYLFPFISIYSILSSSIPFSFYSQYYLNPQPVKSQFNLQFYPVSLNITWIPNLSSGSIAIGGEVLLKLAFSLSKQAFLNTGASSVPENYNTHK